MEKNNKPKEMNILPESNKIDDDSLEISAGSCSDYLVCRFCGCPLWGSENVGGIIRCPNPECGRPQ